MACRLRILLFYYLSFSFSARALPNANISESDSEVKLRRQMSPPSMEKDAEQLPLRHPSSLPLASADCTTRGLLLVLYIGSGQDDQEAHRGQRSISRRMGCDGDSTRANIQSRRNTNLTVAAALSSLSLTQAAGGTYVSVPFS